MDRCGTAPLWNRTFAEPSVDDLRPISQNSLSNQFIGFRSRIGPIENDMCARTPKKIKGTSWIYGRGLGQGDFQQVATSALVNRCFTQSTSWQRVFFNNPDDEPSWNKGYYW